MTRYLAVKGQPPWGQRHESVEENPRELAPQQQAIYHCRNAGCPFTPFPVPLATGVEPPAALDCRCGGTGRLDGAPEDAEVVLPAYGQSTGGRPKGSAPKDGMDPWGQLMKRRTQKELDQILAERLAEVRQTGAAR